MDASHSNQMTLQSAIRCYTDCLLKWRKITTYIANWCIYLQQLYIYKHNWINPRADQDIYTEAYLIKSIADWHIYRSQLLEDAGIYSQCWSIYIYNDSKAVQYLSKGR